MHSWEVTPDAVGPFNNNTIGEVKQVLQRSAVSLQCNAYVDVDTLQGVIFQYDEDFRLPVCTALQSGKIYERLRGKHRHF
jgi:hypothetical protein